MFLKATLSERRGRRQEWAEGKMEMQGLPNDGFGCGRLYFPRMATPTCDPFYMFLCVVILCDADALPGRAGTYTHALEPGWTSVTA